MARRAYALPAGGITASPVKMISREGAKRLASDRQVHSLYDDAAFRNAGKTEPLRCKRDLFASSHESKKSGGEAPRSGTAGGIVKPGARLTLSIGAFITPHFARQVDEAQ